jgi:hypothetical protein
MPSEGGRGSKVASFTIFSRALTMIFAFELPSASGRMMPRHALAISVHLQYQLMASDGLDICERASFDMGTE